MSNELQKDVGQGNKSTTGTYRLVGLSYSHGATLELPHTDAEILWASMPQKLWDKWWPFFKDSEENQWKKKWLAEIDEGRVISIKEWDGWVEYNVDPMKEGYYDVKFEDGTEDEKPFRKREHLNIRGFMTTKKVTHWRDNGKYFKQKY